VIVEVGRQVGKVIDDEFDIRGLGELDDSILSFYRVGFDCDSDDFLFLNRSQRLTAGCQGQYQRKWNVSQPQGAPNERS